MVEFKDGKDEAAFRTIGEVSDALDIKPHVLRYWEQQFSLLKPLKRSGGRRMYRPSDIEMVEAINRLVNEEGYTLKGAEAVLRSGGAPSGSGADRRKSGDRRMGERRVDGDTDADANPDGPEQAFAPDVDDAIANLKAIRARLAKAIEA